MFSVYLVPLVYELCAVCFSFFIFFFLRFLKLQAKET